MEFVVCITRMPIHFYHSTDPYGFLSNYAAAPIFVDGVAWSTTEHYYQAQKFADPVRQEAIRAAPSPDAAKRLAWASDAGLPRRLGRGARHGNVGRPARQIRPARRAPCSTLGDRGHLPRRTYGQGRVLGRWWRRLRAEPPGCAPPAGPHRTSGASRGRDQPPHPGVAFRCQQDRSARSPFLATDPPASIRPYHGTGSRECCWGWRSATRWATRPRG